MYNNNNNTYVDFSRLKITKVYQFYKWLKQNKGILYIVKTSNTVLIRQLHKVTPSNYMFAGLIIDNAYNYNQEHWTKTHNITLTKNGFITSDNVEYKFIDILSTDNTILLQEAKSKYLKTQNQNISSKNIAQAQLNFAQNKPITKNVFLVLLTQHNINISSKTKGWIKQHLIDIQIDCDHCCTYTHTCRYDSTTVSRYALELYLTITKKQIQFASK